MNILKQEKKDAAFHKIAVSHVLGILNRSGLNTTPIFIDNYHIEFIVPQRWNIKQRKVKVFVQFEQSKDIIIPIKVKSTPADLWIHVLSDSIWLCRTADLRNFLFIEPKVKTETHFTYDITDIFPAIFYRIDKLSINKFNSKIQKLCSTKY